MAETHGRKAYMSMDTYHRGLKCRIIPWMHATQSWVGFVYVFDDPQRDDELVYFVPETERHGQLIYIHVTDVYVSKREGVKLGTEPDPTRDELRTVVDLDPAP